MQTDKEQLMVIKCDAACDNNSKFRLMGIGVAVWIDNARDTDFDHKEMAGTGTNNIGEWIALVAGLKLAFAYVMSVNSNVRIRIYSDSQIIIRQFNGVYEVKKDYHIDYYNEARRIYTSISDKVKRVDWIPRQENKDADKLSKEAIRDYLYENKLV